MSAITLRFYVSEMTFGPGPGNGTAKVVLQPAYAQGANAEWASATPSGRIELSVSNPDAVALLNEWRAGRLDLHITAQPVTEVEDLG
jgi:hypothetical protein